MEFANLAGGEREAEAMFREALASNPARCPRCGAERLYALRRDRNRCAACRLTFRLLTGRWAGRLRVSPRQWAVLAVCFVFGMDGASAGATAGVSEPTAYRAFHVIRLSASSRFFADPVLPVKGPPAFLVTHSDGVYGLKRAGIPEMSTGRLRPPIVVYERWFAAAVGPAPHEATVLSCPAPGSWARSEDPGAWMRVPFIAGLVEIIGRRGADAAPDLSLFATECVLRLSLRPIPPRERLAFLLALLVRYERQRFPFEALLLEPNPAPDAP